MGNVRRYRNIKNEAKQFIYSPECKSTTIFHENLIAVESWPTEIRFTKRLYVGASILELSKILMYRFHYDYIKTQRVSEFLTTELPHKDADSFIYKFTAKSTHSIYDMIKRD